jgi:hypothetical protein
MSESESNKIVFKRGDKVSFSPNPKVNINGGRVFVPVQGTYIWAIVHGRYVIQHHHGFTKETYLLPNEKDPELISKQLKEKSKYIWADESELTLMEGAREKPDDKIKDDSKQVIKLNISQSLLKAIYEYAEGRLCGLQFEAQYIKKIPFPSGGVQKLGNYFEYLCTGALPRDGKIPEPERKKGKVEKVIIKKGKKLKNGKRAKDKIEEKIILGELTAPYARMVIQAERFKRTVKAHGIKILKTGLELKYEDKKGVADILAEVDGEEAIIDIKSTGLIGNRFDDMGWDVNALSEKDKIMIQPVFYKWLWRRLYGRDIPFYFTVFSNTNEYDCLFIKVVIDEDRFPQLENVMRNSGKMLDKFIEEGFKAIPDVKECAECPINKTCKSFTDIPLLQTVHY